MLCFAAQMCLGRWMGKVCRATGGRLSRLWSDRPCSAAATQASFRTTSKFEGNLAQRKTVAVHRASSHARPMGGHAGHHLGCQKMPISCGKAFRMRWAFVGKTSRERSRLLNPSASWSALREGSALAARIFISKRRSRYSSRQGEGYLYSTSKANINIDEQFRKSRGGLWGPRLCPIFGFSPGAKYLYIFRYSRYWRYLIL